MRAMELAAPVPAETQPLRLVDRGAPEPGPGEVRIRVAACGVCRTDLHIVEGELTPPALPIVPGHQIVGRVDACGEGATRFAQGEYVGLPWLGATCGKCRFCRSNRENLCENARFTGFHHDGGFAEAVLANEDFACPIPAELEPAAAAPLLCAGIIGYRALVRSEIRPGQTLALYGFGASAHIAIQIARHWECRVLVFTRSGIHQRHARELGADWAGRPGDVPPEPPQSAVIFAPAGELVPQALDILDSGGTLALAGIHMSAIPALDYERHLFRERTLRSVTAATREDAEALMALAADIPIRTTTTAYALQDANQALCDIKHSAIEGSAVLKKVSGTFLADRGGGST